MMKRLLWFTLLAFVNSSLYAQEDSVKFETYAPNIFKITFKPKGYTRNENSSDAVILKPLQSSKFESIKGSEDVSLFRKERRMNGSNLSISRSYKDGNFGFTLPLQESEKIFGGGERALPLNRRGYRLELYNSPSYGYAEGTENLNYSVPFITSSKGYGLFFDNTSKGYIDIGKTNPGVLEFGASSGE